MSVEGQKIPMMKLDVDGGAKLEWPRDLLGQWTLLYIYPKDDTPGCTKQACGYRDNIAPFTKLGVKIYGLSADDLQSHSQFRDKYQLNFPLISDTQKELSTFLKSYGEQERNGNKYMGLSRDTFLINPEGVIQKEWRKVDATSTVATTLSEIQKIIS